MKRGCQILALATVAIMGCSNSTVPANTEHAERAARTFLIDQNFDEWDKYYHRDVTLNGSDLALTIMKGTAQSLHHSFPDVELRVVEQIGTDTKVVTRFVLTGTHEGYFANIKPTQRRVEFAGVLIDEFESGRIKKSFMLLDLYKLGTELSARGGAQ